MPAAPVAAQTTGGSPYDRRTTGTTQQDPGTSATTQGTTGLGMPSRPQPTVPTVQTPVITNQPYPTQQPYTLPANALPGNVQLPAGGGLQPLLPPNRTTTPQQPALPGTQQAAPMQTLAPQQSEFQNFIEQSTGVRLPIFGQDLFQQVPTTFAPVDQVPVPADYVIGPGDEIQIRAWGQIDVDYRAVVDRNGQISIPKVGTLNVAGIKSEQLNGFLRSAIGRIYRNFDLSASLGQLRSVQIFVVGFANRPGVYTVSSLSTLVNTVFAAGGPSVKGSMRKIQLKRGGKLVTEFDMYDLLLRGDKSKDAKLLPEDVVYIPAVGPLAAITGSVNQAAIYELKDGETLGDLLGFAGGLTPTALGIKVWIERIANREVRRVAEFNLDKEGLAKALHDGDLVQVQPLSPRFENAVSIRGNVAIPQNFPWHEGMRVKDLIPNKESLIVPEYWLTRNQAIRRDVKSDLALQTELKRGLPEVNWDYAVISRLNLDNITTTLIPFNLARAVLENDPSQNLPLQPGDVITIFSKDDIKVPVAQQTKFVRLEGEVRSAGLYQAKAGETLRQLLVRVGGLTDNAYLYGAELTRESTREQQQKRLDELIDRLSVEVERNAATIGNQSTGKDEAEAAKLQIDAQRQLVARLRSLKASGRIVLSLSSDAHGVKDLPDVALEDGDRLVVPAKPSTVGVLGAVFNQNSFVYSADKAVSDYLAQAGGPTREADEGRIYVVKADGAVGGGASGSFFGASVGSDRLMPGDTIVVPEDFDRYRFTKNLKDWTQILYQFALGVVGLKVLHDLVK